MRPNTSPRPSELARAYIGGLAHVHTRMSNYSGHYESDQSLASLVRGLEAGGLVGRADSPIRFIALNEHTSNPIRPHTLGRLSLRARMLGRHDWTTHLAGLPIMHGFEASILPDGSTDLTPRLAAQSRLVIASRHHLPNELMFNVGKIERQLRAAVRNEDIDVIGHPLRHIEKLQLDWTGIFAAAAAAGTAIELNLNSFPAAAAEPERYRIWQQWLSVVAASGCAVLIGSDLHNKFQLRQLLADWHKLDEIDQPNRLRDFILALDSAGITPDRVINADYEKFHNYLQRDKADRRL